MQAVVMAGGEGSRLRPLTINRPKPMVSIVNKPCLGHIFDLLQRHGINDAYVTLQYLASQIQDSFGDGGAIGMRLKYSVEESPLGTGGSVRQIGDALDDTFIVISGDALTDIDLSKVIAFHRERKAAVTLTLYHVANPLEYGVVITGEDGRISKFLEKPSWGEVFSDTINTGIYVIEPRVLERYKPGEAFDFSKDLFPALLREGAPLYGYIASGYWTDVGSISEYARANADLLHGRLTAPPLGRELLPGVFTNGDVEIDESARITGPVYLESGAVVGASLIWGSQGRRALFGRFGVTGLVNIDLTPEFCARLGAAYASTLPEGTTVTMNRDQHRSSRMLKRALMGGIVSAGVHVADLGQAPLPIGRFHTRRIGAAGGVHVRISPFDVRVCDVKFFDRQALDMGKAQERKVETVFFREDFRRVSHEDVGGIFESARIGEAYGEAFLAEIVHRREVAAREFKIVVNYSHGTAAQFLPQLLNTLGVELVAINGVVSENVGSRSFDEFQDEKRELAAIVATLGASFGVIIDAGGEKVFVVDDKGRITNDMHFLAAFAALSARVTPGVVAVPVYAPSSIERIVGEAGGRVQRVRASAEAQMNIAAREHPLVVGDGVGGFIFSRFLPSYDGLFATVRLLELLAITGRSLSDVIDEIPPSNVARLQVPCPWDQKGRVMRVLAQDPKTEGTRQVDGVKHQSDSEWVLVLPDADRPLFNVYAEARDEGRAWTLAHEYAERLEQLRASA